MTTPQDFSELDEAAELLRRLLVADRRAPDAGLRRPLVDAPPEAPAREGRPGSSLRSERLEAVLEALCRRGGLVAAVISDQQGLPLAAFDAPIAPEALAAFSSAVGESLAKAGQLLDESAANNVSIDINYTDKAVLRQFWVDSTAYYLTVICPQDADERTEVELSIEQIAGILSQQ